MRICSNETIPFLYAESGRDTGFEHDLLAGFAAKLGRPPEVRFIDPFHAVFTELEAGRCDIASSTVTETPARAERFDLSASYFPVRVVLVSPRSRPIYGLEELAGKRVATIAGTRWEEIVSTVPGVELVLAATGEDSLALLADGRADAVAHDSALVLFQLMDYPSLAISASLSEPEHYVFVLPRGSSLTDKLDDHLRASRADGTYERLLTRYFGAEIAAEIAAAEND